MAYRFLFTKKAEQDLRGLDAVSKKRIAKKLREISGYDDISHVAVTLTGELRGYHRIRVGHYRLVCEMEDTVITVLRVQHRKDVYR